MADHDTHLWRRLLRDVDELCRKPYPNIHLHVHDDELTTFCLVLTPEVSKPLHLTISGLDNYPLDPPTIRMDSLIHHPNVYGDWICATILRKTEEYTPAYTLKSIAIQMLSFFGSESLEQEHGGGPVRLGRYRRNDQYHDDFRCQKCGFASAQKATSLADYVDQAKTTRSSRRGRASAGGATTGLLSPPSTTPSMAAGDDKDSAQIGGDVMHIDSLPTEVLIQVLENMEDFEDVTSLARAWPRVSQVISEFDVLKQRELQCYVLKKSYREVNLGVGVAVGKDLTSEFEFLSKDAFEVLGIRQSIHNIPFSRWLPLPISRRHWGQVRVDAHDVLQRLKMAAPIKSKEPTNAQILYQFMTDVVVKLNLVEVNPRDNRSSLRHASDKAIESYFHLFHLLVCIATEDDSVIRHANRMLANFMAGKRSKEHVPNLGHLLVALLISDTQITDGLMKAIVTEAITRNVIWLLNAKPELCYMEPEAVSNYRLEKTFLGSRTSYRLLMFSELFRRTARPGNAPLSQVREELFNRHGGPPPGAASKVAAMVRRMHGVRDFPTFMAEMGFKVIPTAANFTDFLRRTVRESVAKGYSCWPIVQSEALALRLPREPRVGIKKELRTTYQHWIVSGELPYVRISKRAFFPQKQPAGGNSREGARGGRGGRGN